MVGRQDHDLRVITPQDGFFKSLQRQVALFSVEFREILDENDQATIS